MTTHRIAVTGCGGMARTWVEYALTRSDAEIVALVDIYPATAESLAERYSLSAPVFTNLEEAIAQTGANLVFDVTIPETHHDIVTTAMQNGCHALGEKPMGVTFSEAQQLIQVADTTGKRYAVMQNRRYQKQIRAYRDLVQGGTIGTPGAIYADFFLGPHFGGFRDSMQHPLIVDMAIHTFDQARFILGADPVAVYCHEFNPPGSWYEGAAAATCLFEMSDGSTYSYRGSWCAEGAATSWEASWRVTGSIGTAIWDGDQELYAEVPDEASPPAFLRPVKRIVPTWDWTGREGHYGCFDEMFSALQEDRPAETDCHDNIQSVAMVFAAIESAKRKERVLIRV